MFYASSTAEADRLATLALDAALQIDLMQHGHKANHATLRELGDAIAAFSGIDSDFNPGPRWLDPTSSEMFSNAVNETGARHVSNIQTLNSELAEIVEELRKETGSPAQNIKRFCLAIHDFVHRSQVHGGMNERGVFDYDYSYAG